MERNHIKVKHFLLLSLALCLVSPVNADTIKKSRSGICHDTYSHYYSRTKNYTPFDSLQKCLDSGGRLPKNYGGPGIKQTVANATLEAKVDNRAFSTLYDRSNWPHWADYDRDCQDTRAELLIEQSEVTVSFTNSKRCTVKTGRWTDPFSAQIFTKASDLDIDHIVPLAWAHGHGGQDWPTSRKEEFANDIDNLLVVDDGLNSQKKVRKAQMTGYHQTTLIAASM